jgi:hypothetical protein
VYLIEASIAVENERGGGCFRIRPRAPAPLTPSFETHENLAAVRPPRVQLQPLVLPQFVHL